MSGENVEKLQAAVKRLLNASAASKMLANDTEFLKASGITQNIDKAGPRVDLEKIFKDKVAAAYESAETEIDSLKGKVGAEAVKDINTPNGEDVKAFLEDVSTDIGEGAHKFPDELILEPSESVLENVAKKLENIKAKFKTADAPLHANKFQKDKIKLSDAETKIFADNAEHPAKKAIESAYTDTHVGNVQNNLGELHAAKTAEEVTAAQKTIQSHVEKLVSDTGPLQDLNKEARAGVAQRIYEQGNSSWETGDAAPKVGGKEAEEALKAENLTKTIAEKSGKAESWFKAIKESTTSKWSKGVLAKNGEVIGTGLGRKAFETSKVAAGSVLMFDGANRMRKGAFGHENVETGEPEAPSFGSVLFGGIEAVGGGALALLGAAGRIR